MVIQLMPRGTATSRDFPVSRVKARQQRSGQRCLTAFPSFVKHSIGGFDVEDVGQLGQVWQGHNLLHLGNCLCCGSGRSVEVWHSVQGLLQLILEAGRHGLLVQVGRQVLCLVNEAAQLPSVDQSGVAQYRQVACPRNLQTAVSWESKLRTNMSNTGISWQLQRSLQASKLQALGISCVLSHGDGEPGRHESVRAAAGCWAMLTLGSSGCRLQGGRHTPAAAGSQGSMGPVARVDLLPLQPALGVRDRLRHCGRHNPAGVHI